jgi:HNH endonuclease
MRFDVFKRDGFACKYCGAAPPNVLLEIDHIIPVCEGGTNDETNLITACFDCNRGKSKNALSVIPKSLTERATEIQEREQQIAAYRETVEKRLDRIENDAWTVADIIKPGCYDTGISRDWFRGIKHFNEKLPLDFVLGAAESACARMPYSDRQRFLYFCGICWRKIRAENLEQARDELRKDNTDPDEVRH